MVSWCPDPDSQLSAGGACEQRVSSLGLPLRLSAAPLLCLWARKLGQGLWKGLVSSSPSRSSLAPAPACGGDPPSRQPQALLGF